MSAKTPADFLKNIRGRPVVVKLNSGVDYRGGRERLHYGPRKFGRQSCMPENSRSKKNIKFVGKQHAVVTGNGGNSMKY